MTKRRRRPSIFRSGWVQVMISSPDEITAATGVAAEAARRHGAVKDWLAAVAAEDQCEGDEIDLALAARRTNDARDRCNGHLSLLRARPQTRAGYVATTFVAWGNCSTTTAADRARAERRAAEAERQLRLLSQEERDDIWEDVVYGRRYGY